MRVFCANRIPLFIATILIKRHGLKNNDLVFFDESRCDINLFQNLSGLLIQYTRLIFLKFILASFFKRPDEVCAPHLRGGRLIKIYASYAKKTYS